jgi:hypothetical protein
MLNMNKLEFAITRSVHPVMIASQAKPVLGTNDHARQGRQEGKYTLKQN